MEYDRWRLYAPYFMHKNAYLEGGRPDPRRHRAGMALQAGCRTAVHPDHAGFPERHPRDRKDQPRRRSRARVLPACLELDREMVRLLSGAAGRAQAGARNESDTVRRQARLGGTTAAGAAGAAAPEPFPGAGNRDQPVPAAWSVDHPRPCEPRLRGLEAPGVAEPRGRYRRRPTLRQQPELAGVAGA